MGIAPLDPEANRVETISADETATRLGICVGSVQKLIREGVLPATHYQLLRSAPWQVPVAALKSEAVKIGVREIVGRRPRKYRIHQDDKTLRLPGVLIEGTYYVARVPAEQDTTVVGSDPPRSREVCEASSGKAPRLITVDVAIRRKS
jgi:hypothetical protein